MELGEIESFKRMEVKFLGRAGSLPKETSNNQKLLLRIQQKEKDEPNRLKRAMRLA
ncbi:hypothetical protein RUM43_008300, partial [Polyplax serrata]